MRPIKLASDLPGHISSLQRSAAGDDWIFTLVQISDVDFLSRTSTKKLSNYIEETYNFVTLASLRTFSNGGPVTLKRDATLGLVLDGVWDKESFFVLLWSSSTVTKKRR